MGAVNDGGGGGGGEGGGGGAGVPVSFPHTSHMLSYLAPWFVDSERNYPEHTSPPGTLRQHVLA